MHSISMLLLPVLLLLSNSPRDVSADKHTYQREDPLTGDTLTCDMCPPGTHMTAHCTATTSTECEPCRGDHFTELWNYLPRCLYCSNFCTDNQDVEKECSPTSNRVCRCKEGFFWADDFCIRHSECAPGHGVGTKGTPETDTVCERCAEGSFSSSSSALETCVSHKQCASGETALLPGSVYHDTVCGTCQDLENKDETLRSFFTGFFSTHRVRVTKLKKFVNRFINNSGEDRRPRGTALPKQRGPLLDEIRVWLAQASREELKKIPQMLKAAQLLSMAEKLEKRFSEIKQQYPNCGLTLM